MAECRYACDHLLGDRFAAGLSRISPRLPTNWEGFLVAERRTVRRFMRALRSHVPEEKKSRLGVGILVLDGVGILL